VNEPSANGTALERASLGEDIVPFSDFLADLVRGRLAGEPLPAVPQGAFNVDGFARDSGDSRPLTLCAATIT
jgi:hypothetical protein